MPALAVLLAMSGSQMAAGAPQVVPLPEPNPKREKVSPKQAAKTVDLPNPKPTGFGFAAAIQPLLDYKLSKADRQNLKGAVSAVYKGRFPAAQAAHARIKDPSARKLAQWYAYRRNGVNAKAADIEAFRVANPLWPNQRRLRRNAEQSLFMGKAAPETIAAFFATSSPETGAGLAALASMHAARGDKTVAAVLVRRAWRSHRLNKSVEKAILARFPGMLRAEDHKGRVNALLFRDRRSRIAAALRAAKHLSAQERKKIDARVAVVRRSRAAKKLLAAIPDAAAKDDVGFYFSRIQWLRRQKRYEEAWELLRNAPSEPDKLVDLGEWWVERRIHARAALNAGHPDIAYEIASEHGPLKGKHYHEAQFLSGWMALRFLGRIQQARDHFLALRTAALTPKRIARAEYWLGRAAAANGEQDEAARHYARAAAHGLTYYGQLARQTLDPSPAALPLEPAPRPSEADVQRFLARDAVRAIGVVRAAGLTKLTRVFFYHLARSLKSPAEIVLLAELARAIEQQQASVRLGKIALNRGHPVTEIAYPLGLLPDYRQLGRTVDPALLHALSRQESEFNPKAKSPVGARGLMQLMPRTARAVARQHKVRYRRAKLTADPAYNMMLGVAHLGDLLDQYHGSYILVLVAYNAGGGRVRDWTKQFEDPRQNNVDPIDWVERIPFTETRNYVQKILSTMQIFRSRIEGPDGALRLMQDLNRAEKPPREPQVEEQPQAEDVQAGPPPEALQAGDGDEQPQAENADEQPRAENPDEQPPAEDPSPKRADAAAN